MSFQEVNSTITSAKCTIVFLKWLHTFIVTLVSFLIDDGLGYFGVHRPKVYHISFEDAFPNSFKQLIGKYC